MKIVFIFLVLSILVNCHYDFGNIKYVEETIECSKGSTNEWKQKQYYLPETFVVQGTASGYLPVEKLSILLTVESKQDEAANTLKMNNNKIAHMMRDLIRIGIKQEEISTSDLQIYPIYNKVFDVEKQDYKNAIEWYVVENKVTIVTKKTELAGKIIDIAISRGIEKVDSVQFSPLSENITKLKDKLIVEAVEDAQRRALLALNPINYEIIAVKNVELDSYQKPLQRRYSQVFGHTHKGSTDASTNVYSSDQNFQTSVQVSFIIRQKTKEFTSKGN